MTILTRISLIYNLLIVKESLDDADIDNIKMFSLRLEANISHSTTNKFRCAYVKKIELETVYRMQHCVAVLSQIKPHIYHCCANTCVAFTNNFADLTACPVCSEPHYNNGKPCATFKYLPIIPRLQGLYENAAMIDTMSYRANRKRVPGEFSDIFDGNHYCTLMETDLAIEGIQYDSKFFECSTDITLGLISDGVQVCKKP